MTQGAASFTSSGVTKSAAAQPSGDARGFQQRQRAARRQSQRQTRVLTRGARQIEHIAGQRLGDMDALGLRARASPAASGSRAPTLSSVVCDAPSASRRSA